MYTPGAARGWRVYCHGKHAAAGVRPVQVAKAGQAVYSTSDALRTVRNMNNPFQYGGIVEGGAFCNRKKDLADLRAGMQSGEKLYLVFRAAAGKTSLVQTALRGLPKGRYAAAYVDLGCHPWRC